ncbi:hypothetical protein [Stenotrophomonas sp. GZD-301]|uniref:hypothetical protein n=1 Tax=Stenotrophomonas sp. GZD-301 TaxID=3404814 RepID=UPI003BB76751
MDAAPAPAPVGPPALLPLEDQGYLRLLSIFHYVVAGLMALFSLFPLLYIGIGLGIVNGWFPANNQASGGPSDQMAGWLFVGMGALFLVTCLTMTSLMVLAGRSLAQRRRHTLCLVVAALSCLFTPFGTVLGVFTLVVLLKPAVKAAFQPLPALP